MSWASVHKAAKKCLDALVDTLYLTVRLWMVGEAELKLGVCCLEQIFPKVTGKYAVAVGDNSSRKTVKAIHLVHENLGNRGCCKRMAQWNEVGKLGELIHHY